MKLSCIGRWQGTKMPSVDTVGYPIKPQCKACFTSFFTFCQCSPFIPHPLDITDNSHWSVITSEGLMVRAYY